jgi:hypothetical protein
MAVQLLSEVLAGIVGLGSVTLYLAAFFFPEVHRRHDFFWSGVGCFYALILWIDAGQITPTELVGHLASISLMGWLGWQTLALRRKRTPAAQQTPYTADSWPTFRREMTGLALDALRQTPLRRWLPDSASEPAQGPGIRVSALKDVGYEFVDSVEPPNAVVLPRRLGSPITETPPPRLRPQTAPARVTPSPVTSAPVTQPQRTPSPSIQPPIPHPPATPPVEKSSWVAPSSPPKAKGMTWGQRVQGLVTWGQEVVRSKTAPKPKKPVIEIPPRPSSLAKRAPASASSTPDAAAVKPMAVQSAPGSVLPTDRPSESLATDASDATSAELPQTPSPGAMAETMPEAADRPASGVPPSIQPSQDGIETSNWDDEDEDWI